MGAVLTKEYGRTREKLLRKIKMYAVRGVLSLSRLEAIMGRQPFAFVICDPGLLSGLLADTCHIARKYRLGIIPRYVDQHNSILIKLSQSIRGSRIICITDEPPVVLSQISECDAILSTAMHGLITPDSPEIPNLTVDFNGLDNNQLQFKEIG